MRSIFLLMNLIQSNFNTTEKKLYRCRSTCSFGIHCIALDFRSKQCKTEHPASDMMTEIFHHKCFNYMYKKYTDVAILY